jgi:hypothetical protein
MCGDILRCDDLSGEDIAGRQESNPFAPSNKSLSQPLAAVKSTFNFMKQFSMLRKLAAASGG